MRTALLTALTMLVFTPSAQALPQKTSERLVRNARALLGTPYNFGGRLSKQRPGVDCQGVLFYAAEKIGRCGWKSFSVFPTKSVARRELGGPLAGASPVATRDLDINQLAPGDILLLVGEDKNPVEPAIGQLDGTPVWVWHTGMYTGAGKWIVGDHYAGEVVEVDLLSYLVEHRDAYAGVFVTRMVEGPTPKRCRRHRPMNAPRTRR